jgi:hypothetical protein
MNAPTELPANLTPETAKALGIRNSGFGSWLRKTEIAVVITIRPGFGRERYGVYVSHGAPGGAFWRSDEPLVRCDTLEKAREKAETLYGISGCGSLAAIVHL